MKKISIIFLIILLFIIGIIFIYNNQIKKEDKVTYITDSDYLYDVAIDNLKNKYFLEDKYNKKEDYQMFLDYKGFGISEKDNKKYAYMWILKESYYVENNKLISDSGSSMAYKFEFENDVVVNYEIPKDGSYYTNSIKEMFPYDIEKTILKFEMNNDNLEKKVNEHYSYINNHIFEATVIDVNDNQLIVMPYENTNEIKSSDKISLKNINKNIKIGDKVRITYNGEILESYPAQIDVIKIELIS